MRKHMPQNDCTEQIYSNEYYDFIAETNQLNNFDDTLISNSCLTPIDSVYSTILLPRNGNLPLSLNNYPYTSIPKCYGLSDTQAIEASGIYSIQRYPGLELSGKDVLIGFIDTGIDYRNDVFKDINGKTRIAAIWDQTIISDSPPFSLKYGTEYTREQINEALNSESPFDIVPSTDDNGHGTTVAGVAAGSFLPDKNFIGAAPGCDIAMVKLKDAKPYLKDFYCIFSDEPCFQENDIMAGIAYLEALANSMRKPLVICLSMETNMGDHEGNSSLGTQICILSTKQQRTVVTNTGNEANQGHHYFGIIDSVGNSEDVELRVDEQTKGLTVELWASTPDLFSISLISPTGEEMPRIPVSRTQMVTHRFIFEQTMVQIEYLFSSLISGAELIQLRFRNLKPGIWIIRVYSSNHVTGQYNIWIPIQSFIGGDTYFLRSNPDITLSNMSTVNKSITTGSYNSVDESISINSGRGYTRLGRIKPELCSPGVNVYSPLTDNRFAPRSGGSIAAAICSGACALFMDWAITQNNEPLIDAARIKSTLTRGTQTQSSRSYPNRECGYGTLDLYHAFESLRIN